MNDTWPRARGPALGTAIIRQCPEDFLVREQLGFCPSGAGEHCFLYLRKRNLTTFELRELIADVAAVSPVAIGYCGMKDRNAVTEQWFSIGLAGRTEPDWSRLEAGTGVELLAKGWHRRKLRRGVHQANKFSLVLRDLDADNQALEKRLQVVREEGVPNYFGEQRFGRNGSTLRQAREWMRRGRRVSRDRRSLYLSALRAWVFNGVLAQRVRQGDWNLVRPGDRCMLRGSRSHFGCDTVTEDIVSRAAAGDLSPGLPLWGQVSDDGGKLLTGMNEEARAVCEFLTEAGLTLAWRSTRLLPDDFSWQFCDDGSLHLGFDLVAGSYATALLAECLLYKNGAVREH